MNVNRQELLAPIVRSIELEIGKGEAFESALKEWDVLPLIHGGRHAGTFMVKGTEIHFALTDGAPSGSVRKSVRESLETIMDKYGFLTTKAPRGNFAANTFIKRVGFKPTWKDDVYQYYMLAELPWSKPREV